MSAVLDAECSTNVFKRVVDHFFLTAWLKLDKVITTSLNAICLIMKIITVLIPFIDANASISFSYET